MLYEFAVEPDSVADSGSCGFVLSHMGVSRGRMISRFPGDWRKRVIETVQEHKRDGRISDKDFKKISKLLQTVGEKLLRKGRDYDPEETWIDNAISQDAREPFRAIVMKSPLTEGCEKALDVQDLDEDPPLWAVPREAKVARLARDIVQFIGPLLEISRKILFVDPYFDPGIRKWIPLIRESLKVATAGGRSLDRVEIHTLDSEKRLEPEEFKRRCEQFLAPAVPKGVSLRIVRWKEKDEKFHARYVFTDRGGYRLETGLDEGGRAETQDVSLLDDKLYRERLRQFEEGSTVFELSDEFRLPA